MNKHDLQTDNVRRKQDIREYHQNVGYMDKSCSPESCELEKGEYRRPLSRLDSIFESTWVCCVISHRTIELPLCTSHTIPQQSTPKLHL